MATLSKGQIQDYWKKPQNGTAIQQAAKDNERQMFHSMLTLRAEDTNAYKDAFLSKVKGILNNDDKFTKFKSFMTYPLVSNALVSKASDEWNKVYYAQDRVKEYNFVDESTVQAFEAYLDKIDFQTTLEQDLFTLVKQSVQHIAVVDIPSIEDNQPALPNMATEPYVYFVDTGKIHDVGVNGNGSIGYLIFVRNQTEDPSKRQLVVIDDQAYRVFDIDDRNQGALSDLIDSPHDLGYCPATFIWRDFIDQSNKIRRYNSVLEIVEKLDRYVMLTIFREHSDLYASYPIMWRYVDACEDGDDMEQLKTGLLGPGQLVEVSVPSGDGSRMSVPTGFVENNPALLKYIEDKLRKLEVEISKHLTGVDNEIQNEKAFNESQVRSQYETRHSVLRYWAENVQYVHSFLVNTIAKLIYGEKFVSSTIDYGMDYFLYDTLTATKEYQDGKEAGLPGYLLSVILNKVEQAHTRNNPNAAARIQIMKLLEPYVHYTLDVINPVSVDYELKANFQHYIDLFELENGSILKFGSKVNIGQKIKTIKLTLYDYVKEHRELNPPIQVGIGGQASGGSAGQSGGSSAA